MVQTIMFVSLGEEKSSLVKGLKTMAVTVWVASTVVHVMLYLLGIGGDRVIEWLAMGYLG